MRKSLARTQLDHCDVSGGAASSSEERLFSRPTTPSPHFRVWASVSATYSAFHSCRQLTDCVLFYRATPDFVNALLGSHLALANLNETLLS